MISGRGSETEKVVGLELGADDYIVKPFMVRELIARMRAVQRRRLAAAPTAPTPRPRDRYGRATVDRRAHRAFLDGVEVPLTPREYALPAFLTDRMDTLVTRETIMASVWHSDGFGPTKTLDTNVSALRHKLGDALSVQAVRDVGFRLKVGPETSSRPG